MSLQPVSVSLVASASRCPVRAFFSLSSPWQESLRYTICKQLSYHLGSPLSFDTILDEIQGIKPHIGKEDTAFLESCINHCNRHHWRRPTEYDLGVRSDAYGLQGTIDRIFSEFPYFSVTRPVMPPVAGIYSQDRVRIAAYSFCLSEMLGKEITGGMVDYIPGGESRFCEIQPGDIRKFYSARRVVQNLKAGTVPNKPINAPCTRCIFQDRCDPGPRRLSEFL